MNSCYCIASYFHGAKNFIENMNIIFVIIFYLNS